MPSARPPTARLAARCADDTSHAGRAARGRCSRVGLGKQVPAWQAEEADRRGRGARSIGVPSTTRGEWMFRPCPARDRDLEGKGKKERKKKKQADPRSPRPHSTGRGVEARKSPARKRRLLYREGELGSRSARVHSRSRCQPLPHNWDKRQRGGQEPPQYSSFFFFCPFLSPPQLVSPLPQRTPARYKITSAAHARQDFCRPPHSFLSRTNPLHVI